MRYRLLESTRVYAREKLSAAGELDVCAGYHLRYLRDLFVSAHQRWTQSGRRAELEALLISELEDVRAALDGALVLREISAGAQLMAAIANRWQIAGLIHEANRARRSIFNRYRSRRHSRCSPTSRARFLV